MRNEPRKPTLRYGSLFTVFVFLVYMYPASQWNGYIPFVLIGVLFLVSLIWNGFVLNVSGCFFLFTLYALISNLILYPLMTNSSLIKAILSSLFLLIPFFSFQIGKHLGIRVKDFPFVKVAFIIICIEFIVIVLQNVSGSIGFTLIQIYGGDKYSLAYTIAGSKVRCIGTFGNPNTLGVAMLVFLSVILIKSKNRLIRILALVLTTVIILFTFSRTAFVLELIVLVLVYGRLLDSGISGGRRIRNLILIALAIFLLYGIYTRVVSREISYAAMGGRISIWKRLLKSIDEDARPAGVALRTIFGRGVSYVKGFEDTDNEYLFVYLATGIVGLALWLSELLIIVRRTFSLKAENRMIGISVLVLWLVSVLASSFYTNYLLSFFSFSIWGYLMEQGRHDTA